VGKLSLKYDEEEVLMEVLIHPGYKVLLGVLDRVIAEQRDRVVQYRLVGGTDRELAFIKCRHEGAMETKKNLQDLLTRVKKDNLHK